MRPLSRPSNELVISRGADILLEDRIRPAPAAPPTLSVTLETSRPGWRRGQYALGGGISPVDATANVNVANVIEPIRAGRGVAGHAARSFPVGGILWLSAVPLDRTPAEAAAILNRSDAGMPGEDRPEGRFVQVAEAFREFLDAQARRLQE